MNSEKGIISVLQIPIYYKIQIDIVLVIKFLNQAVHCKHHLRFVLRIGNNILWHFAAGLSQES